LESKCAAISRSIGILLVRPPHCNFRTSKQDTNYNQAAWSTSLSHPLPIHPYAIPLYRRYRAANHNGNAKSVFASRRNENALQHRGGRRRREIEEGTEMIEKVLQHLLHHRNEKDRMLGRVGGPIEGVWEVRRQAWDMQCLWVVEERD